MLFCVDITLSLCLLICATVRGQAYLKGAGSVTLWLLCNIGYVMLGHLCMPRGCDYVTRTI